MRDDGGEQITTTAGHPFLVAEGQDLKNRPAVEVWPEQLPADAAGGRWVLAADLQPGDVLLSLASGPLALEEVSSQQAETVLHNFFVEPQHTYAVGTTGICVHNASTPCRWNGPGDAPGGLKGVVDDAAQRAKDIAKGAIVDGKYIKNPTATKLDGIVSGTGKIGRKNSQFYDGEFMYVVDDAGDIIIGSRSRATHPEGLPHPTLTGGANPQARAAGIVKIQRGQIKWIDDASGHFQHPNSLQAAREAFGKLPDRAFRRDFVGYLPFDR